MSELEAFHQAVLERLDLGLGVVILTAALLLCLSAIIAVRSLSS